MKGFRVSIAQLAPLVLPKRRKRACREEEPTTCVQYADGLEVHWTARELEAIRRIKDRKRYTPRYEGAIKCLWPECTDAVNHPERYNYCETHRKLLRELGLDFVPASVPSHDC